ncbi:MAG: hypothetical protein P4L81_08050 [Candidatus Pacebacteria bacterium]|nr:hypothetical protein [Candidatus Paceibacterota bacterium]
MSGMPLRESRGKRTNIPAAEEQSPQLAQTYIRFSLSVDDALKTVISMSSRLDPNDFEIVVNCISYSFFEI